MVKILFLPHCLEKYIYDKIDEIGKEKNYGVYVAKGGSMVKKIIDKYLKDGITIDRIVGIACPDEVNLALKYFDGKGLDSEIVFPIPLSVEGCKNTKVDLEKVLAVL